MPLLDRPAVRRWSLIALLALAAAGAVAVVAVRHWRGRPERTRIVVAVFANRTGDPELEQFGSMAADWVTRGLARTPTVEVVDLGALYVEGRTASGQPTDPLELARRNGAGSVVAGSYYVSEDTLAVRSTVIDGTTGEVLQTVTPVRVGRNESVKALELLQQQVMTAVAGALDVEFRPFTAQPSAPPPYAAYQAFVAGQTAYWQGRPASEARDFFQYAAASDSTFLTAVVWLAFVGANGAGCALTDSVTRALAGRTTGHQPVRPAHARHQRGALPQPLARGLPSGGRAGGAPPAIDLCRVHGRILCSHERAAARRPRVPPQHRPGARARLALGFRQERVLA